MGICEMGAYMTNAKEFLDSESVMFATVLMCCNSWQRKIHASVWFY